MKGESASCAGRAFHGNGAPVEFHDGFHEGEPEAGTAGVLGVVGAGMFGPVEAVEKPWQMLRGDAFTLILHGNGESVTPLCCRQGHLRSIR